MVTKTSVIRKVNYMSKKKKFNEKKKPSKREFFSFNTKIAFT